MMKVRSMLVGLVLLAASVLTGCGDNVGDAPSEGIESTYCVDAQFNIVDGDYCNPDESEYDPANYYWWFGIVTNPLRTGQSIPSQHRASGTTTTGARPTPTRTTRPSSPSTARPSSGSTVRPPQQTPRPQAPSAPRPGGSTRPR